MLKKNSKKMLQQTDQLERYDLWHDGRGVKRSCRMAEPEP